MTDTPSDGERVDGIVGDFLAAREEGRETTLDELCRDFPDQRKPAAYAIAKFLRIEAMFAAGRDRPPPVPPRGADGRYSDLCRAESGGMGELFRAMSVRLNGSAATA